MLFKHHKLMRGSAGAPRRRKMKTIATDSTPLQYVCHLCETNDGHGCSWTVRRVLLGAEERQEVGIRCSSFLLWLHRCTCGHMALMCNKTEMQLAHPCCYGTHLLILPAQTRSASGITVYAPTSLFLFLFLHPHPSQPPYPPNPNPALPPPTTIQHCASLGLSFPLLWNGNISSISSTMHRWSSAA